MKQNSIKTSATQPTLERLQFYEQNTNSNLYNKTWLSVCLSVCTLPACLSVSNRLVNHVTQWDQGLDKSGKVTVNNRKIFEHDLYSNSRKF